MVKAARDGREAGTRAGRLQPGYRSWLLRLVDSTERPDPGPQRMLGEEQQLPLWQATPAGHVIPQPPQFVGSVCRFAQAPLGH